MIIEDPVARGAAEAALSYMGLRPGQRLSEVPISAVFIGSCANARLGDLRAAAEVVRGHRISPALDKAIVVPGSSEVKRLAEAEGLDAVFRDAGFEWRESGCSLCFFGGGEGFAPGARVASTTNRNFENRRRPAPASGARAKHPKGRRHREPRLRGGCQWHAPARKRQMTSRTWPRSRLSQT